MPAHFLTMSKYVYRLEHKGSRCGPWNHKDPGKINISDCHSLHSALILGEKIDNTFIGTLLDMTMPRLPVFYIPDCRTGFVKLDDIFFYFFPKQFEEDFEIIYHRAGFVIRKIQVNGFTRELFGQVAYKMAATSIIEEIEI